MPRKGTKAAKIMALHKRGDFTIREIADAVGCRTEYVRVVARQRKGSGMSEIDRRYDASEKGRASYERFMAKKSQIYRDLPREKRCEVYRTVYRAARNNGKDVQNARRMADNAVWRHAYAYRREAAHA